ncbi:MAG: lipid-A-disaccharide synthase, partial [Chloroflexaceae bacterium]|nr:lipid-A-disaccharide synthase [Chloroflexaceae bacterium]
QHNPLLTSVGGVPGRLVIPEPPQLPYLETPNGTAIELLVAFPAHEWLARCRLCITTVGANTAQLAYLGVPMLVLLPTQQLDAMRAWDGLPGLLARSPLFGSLAAKAINAFVLRQGRLFAWPNIWVGEAIVPEIKGQLQAPNIAELVLDYLRNPGRLQAIQRRLRQVCRRQGRPLV